jgi:hypothetical protein
VQLRVAGVAGRGRGELADGVWGESISIGNLRTRPQRKRAQRESQIWRKRSYVRHGLSPTTDEYQSSWSVGHTVALFWATAACAAARNTSASTRRRESSRVGSVRGMLT